MIKIRIPNFYLQFEFQKKPIYKQNCPYEDWLHFLITVKAEPFSGTFKWEVMPLELKRFRDELKRIYKDLKVNSVATLSGLNRGVFIKFEVLNTGNINGTYELCNDFDIESPVLSGKLFFDQTYLPDIIDDIQSLLDLAQVDS